MKRSTNVIITLVVAGLQFFAVNDLIHSTYAIKWMIAISSFVKLAQVIVASGSNPDGTPASVAFVEKQEGL